jgi:multidrug resistance protein, MATE family
VATPPVSIFRVATKGNPHSTILRLAAPTVFAMLSQSAVNEVDIVFFSRLPCPESSIAQAALLPSLILLWAFGGSLSAISVGTQAISARRFAEGDTTKAGGVLVNSWMFSTLASLAFTVLAYFTLPSLLSILIKVPEVRQAADSYIGWRLFGITSMVVTFSFKSFFDGIGKTHVHMWSAIVMNVVNVLLCGAFIFGQWGAPRMGIAGAGLAAFASTWIGLAIMVGWVLLPAYRKTYRPFTISQFDPKVVLALLKLSVPSAVATLAVMSGFAMFSMIVSHLDFLLGSQVATTAGAAVDGACAGAKTEAPNSAATMVIVGILKLTITACLAFGTATATLVSQSLGEGEPEQAEKFGWASVKLGLAIFGGIGFLEGVVFPHQIMGLVSQSEAVRAAAFGPFQLMAACTPLIACGMILTQALFGAGNTLFVMAVELVLHFLCLVPLAWLFGITLGFGLMGIWSAAAVYAALLTAVMAWKFSRKDWQNIRI